MRLPRALDGELPNLRVVWGRAEEQPTDAYGVAVAKALAPPPVAAEWCLPLVRAGRCVRVLCVGPTADVGRGRAAWRERSAAASRSSATALLVDPEGRADAGGLPAPAGVARKRPLA